MRYTLTWIALALAIAVGIGSINLPFLTRLTSRGVVGHGVVLELLPKIHNTVRYEYLVSGRKIEGQTQSSSPNNPPEQLKVGQSLVVCYDPLHPESSVLGYPRPILINEIVSVLLAATLGPTLIVTAWVWRKSRRSPRHLDKPQHA
jgi:hypothetical protein